MERNSFMAPFHRNHLNFALYTLSSYQHPSPNPDHPFPILGVAVLSIMGTTFLLLAYFIIVNRCCCCYSSLHWLVSLGSWLHIRRRATTEEDSFIDLSPAMWHRGLNESLIQEIPTLQYQRGQAEEVRGSHKCVVCLSEFQEEDTLRVLPSCSHWFHLDCIDVWLQGNSNCPLCRTSISGRCSKYPIDCLILAPSSSPQGSQQYQESILGGDEDFVVIELGGNDDDDGFLLQRARSQRDRAFPGEAHLQIRRSQYSPMTRNRHHVSAMGDECIDVRGKDERFSVQPIRRSFSLDSAADRQAYLNVQAVIQQQQSSKCKENSTAQECSNRSGPKSFFPVGHGRVSRSAVLPIDIGS